MTDNLQSPAKRLFFGDSSEELLFPFPEIDSEHKEIGREMTNAIIEYAKENIKSGEFDEASKLPESVIKDIAEMGLAGLGVEESYGGLGLGPSLYARVFMEVAGIDGSLATMLGAHQSIGYKGLCMYGTQEQKDKWLPLLASGEKFASFCLTEPSSGSDAYSLRTKAVDKGDHFEVTGQKLWITNAGRAEFYTVFCKTQEGDNEKITALILEKNMEGISFGELEKKMGIKASETRAVFFDKVKVPKENILGERGKGFKMALEILNAGRLSLGSGCVGGMKTLIKLSIEHACERKQFGRSLSEFGIIQEKLVQMEINCFVSESLVFMTTGLMDKGFQDNSIESAICKIYASEALWDTVDTSMQIAAGIGYMKEYPYEQMMRDSRIHLIFEGTNEILRCLVALTGLKGPSEFLKELQQVNDFSKALSDPLNSLGILSDFALKRVEKYLPTKSLSKVHPTFEKCGQQFLSLLSEFSIKAENSLIKHGKKIIEDEFIQKRLADMCIQLYAMMAILSRGTKYHEDEHTVLLTKRAFRQCRYKFIHASKELSKDKGSHWEKIAKGLIKEGKYPYDVI